VRAIQRSLLILLLVACDPAFLAGRKRLDAAFAQSRSDVDAAVAHGKALQSEAAAAMRQGRLWGRAALLAILAVLAIRAAVGYFGAC
jgi:hypothetical protein